MTISDIFCWKVGNILRYLFPNEKIGIFFRFILILQSLLLVLVTEINLTSFLLGWSFTITAISHPIFIIELLKHPGHVLLERLIEALRLNLLVFCPLHISPINFISNLVDSPHDKIIIVATVPKLKRYLWLIQMTIRYIVHIIHFFYRLRQCLIHLYCLG